MKKQISLSQHSSISQADDCSSPYARVRSPLHGYDKVLPSEHPYAQISKSTNDNNNENRPTTSSGSMSNSNLNAINNNNTCDSELNSSHESLLDSVDGSRQHQVKFEQFSLVKNDDFNEKFNFFYFAIL